MCSSLLCKLDDLMASSDVCFMYTMKCERLSLAQEFQQVPFFFAKVILLNLLICVIIFYSVYYVVLCICFTAFRLQMLDGLAPFDFKTNPSWLNPNYLVLLVSLEITYFMSALLFVLVVEEWVWDYAITVTVIHIAITTAVKSEFPMMLHWWVALGSGLISMICVGQSLAYYLFKDNFIYPVLDYF